MPVRGSYKIMSFSIIFYSISFTIIKDSQDAESVFLSSIFLLGSVYNCSTSRIFGIAYWIFLNSKVDWSYMQSRILRLPEQRFLYNIYFRFYNFYYLNISHFFPANFRKSSTFEQCGKCYPSCQDVWYFNELSMASFPGELFMDSEIGKNVIARIKNRKVNNITTSKLNEYLK